MKVKMAINFVVPYQDGAKFTTKRLVKELEVPAEFLGNPPAWAMQHFQDVAELCYEELNLESPTNIMRIREATVLNINEVRAAVSKLKEKAISGFKNTPEYDRRHDAGMLYGLGTDEINDVIAHNNEGEKDNELYGFTGQVADDANEVN